MKKIKFLKELKTIKNNYDIQYRSRSMSFDKINQTELKNLKNLEDQNIFQIWSYSTIVGYLNLSNNIAVFTDHKYSRTTTKQINQLCNENNLQKMTINKTFVNWSTFEDLATIKDLLLGGAKC